MLNMKFHSKPVYDEKYKIAKVKTFDGVVNTAFWSDEIPNENVHYTCIAGISIYSVMKMDKKNYPQLYLQECRYKIQKKKMTRFIDVELDLDGSDDSDSE